MDAMSTMCNMIQWLSIYIAMNVRLFMCYVTIYRLIWEFIIITGCGAMLASSFLLGIDSNSSQSWYASNQWNLIVL